MPPRLLPILPVAARAGSEDQAALRHALARFEAGGALRDPAEARAKFAVLAAEVRLE